LNGVVSRHGKDQAPPPSFLIFSPVPAHLAHYARSLGLAESYALKALTRLITCQLDVADPAVLVFKPPYLILLHRSDSARTRQLEAQALDLDRSCKDLLYVDLPRVVEICQDLTSRLIDYFGEQEISNAFFTAIPRGGFIVLDHLTSMLALDFKQLHPSNNPDQLTVVVDDCAISGLRFKQFIDGCPSRRIVFAHLYSHPDLRAAIEARESRVVACVSAEDLREVSKTVPPEHEQRRRERIERGECYWIGSTEALCFPWNEPDRSFWNPATGRQERAWKIVPPELCGKNHPAPGTTLIPIQIQPEGRGPLRPSQRAVFGELGGALVLCDMATGQCFGLEGVAADLWRALLVHGDPEAVASALQGEYDVPGEMFRKDAQNFFKDLEARDLIEWTEPA
jgi:hypothetical protein